jgi:phenylacetate-CoA ligase
MLAVPVGDLVRIYTSPGPILDPEGRGEDFWRFRPAFEAAGLGHGQVVLNTFSYHLTPGGMMLDAGLRAAGCVVIPGGVGNTAAQIELARSAGATGYVGTPQFLLVLLEKAVELETPLPLERAAVTGAPFPPDLREAVAGHGVEAFECYGTADAGTLGFECSEHAGWHVSPGVVIEIADPATGEPLPSGETGEVLVTSPNAVYPLLRFGTGDLSAWMDEGCACGRKSPRLSGFLGRSGEGIKVKGMFVHPRQIAAALAPYDEFGRWQAVVTAEGHRDLLTVRIECAGPVEVDAVQEALRTQVKVGLEVEFLPPDTLPVEGRRVVDAREQ